MPAHLPIPAAACATYVRAVGTPLYTFVLREVQHADQLLPELRADAAGRLPAWQLAYTCQDTVLANGGLIVVSEAGRLVGLDPRYWDDSNDESDHSMSGEEDESDGDQESLWGSSDEDGSAGGDAGAY